MHGLTHSDCYNLVVFLENLAGRKELCTYRIFIVGEASSNYRLSIGDYEGRSSAVERDTSFIVTY